MLCPLRRASESLSTTRTPTPSPQPEPSAVALKDLQRPSTDIPRCREKPTNTDGEAITVAPPTSASEHSPARSDCAARCSATREDEHAVSIVTAGPSRPKVNASRPDRTLVAMPVRRWPSEPPDSAEGLVP